MANEGCCIAEKGSYKIFANSPTIVLRKYNIYNYATSHGTKY